VCLLTAVLVLELELFERTIDVLAQLEKFEIDEFITPSLIFFGFLFVDLNHRHHQTKVEAEKAKIYKAMIGSVQHVLNNFLNQLLIFKMEAEETPGFDTEIIAIYDSIIAEAKGQIKELSSVISIDEETIRNSVKPK
jgi:hypothetical protein